MKSQNQKILAHLYRGRTLTAIQALERFGCFRLAARIVELKRRGHKIKADRYTLKSGKVVARYSYGGA